jgi:hypothetical protein
MRIASNDPVFRTGYKFYDEPPFGQASNPKYQRQPDYKIAPLWPLYLYIDTIKKLVQLILLETN